MFYELKRGRVGLITYQELRDDYVMYGFPEQTVLECGGNSYNFRSNNYVQEDLVFVVLDVINLLDVFGDKNRVALYIRNDLCLVVDIRDENGSIRRQFEDVVKRYETTPQGLRQTVPEKFLYHFLERLIYDDKKFLENMEFNMSVLENRMLEEKTDHTFINEIFFIKKELIYIWNYYEQLIDVGEVLRDNENDMYPEENVRRFSIFTDHAARLSENVKYLKEYTVQLREAHDAMLNYNLNSIMKFFTVITTIFLPLTLIVGWYGMNFVNMPELTWKYGYVGVIVFSVLVVILCIVAFKKYRLL